jgi:hypothetical protein
MGKKHRTGKKSKIASVKPSAKQAALDHMAPLRERYRNYEFDGFWMDHGIREVDVEISAGGIVSKTKAYLNTMEAPALDGLYRAKVLNDPRDEGLAERRRLAGLALRRIFHRSKIQAKSTGLYDKPLNAMMSSSQHPKSNKAENCEVEFIRLMRRCFPYNTVVRNVCCLDERPPTIIRHGMRTPCMWDVALRAGLDILAEELFTRAGFPRRRNLMRPRIGGEENAPMPRRRQRDRAEMLAG